MRAIGNFLWFILGGFLMGLAWWLSMVGMTRPGAYAEFMSIPAASLIAMPQDLSDRVAALTEPAAPAWHAIDLTLRALARPIHECRVLVIGGGAIGMLAALLLRHLGARRVVLAELNERLVG